MPSIDLTDNVEMGMSLIPDQTPVNLRAALVLQGSVKCNIMLLNTQSSTCFYVEA